MDEHTRHDRTVRLLAARLESLAVASLRSPGGERVFQDREVSVTNQFGTERLMLVRPENLCVPASKDGIARTGTLDRFRCYGVRRVVSVRRSTAISSPGRSNPGFRRTRAWSAVTNASLASVFPSPR